MLRVDQLSFSYKKSKQILNNISFSLEEGYLYCLLGNNGAGKTTLLRVMYGVLAPASGSVTYNNMTVAAAKNCGKAVRGNLLKYRRDAALVGNNSWCLDGISMGKNVEGLAGLYDNFDWEEYGRILKLFSLKDSDKEKPYSELSTGQKMGFQLAFALARHPRLLLLDEPFANLDPVVKVDVSRLLQEKMKKENITVIVSTHLVDDISDIVDYVGVMRVGEPMVFRDRESLLLEKQAEGLRDYILGGV